MLNFSPRAATGDAGATVTISGANFEVGATAKVGDDECDSTVVVDPSTATCTLPSRSVIGAANIAIENPDTQADVSSGRFYSLGAPIVWLRAKSISASNGTLLTNFPDSSGNGLNASQSLPLYRPRFISSSNIGGPGVRFTESATPDFLVFPDSALLKPPHLSIFSVFSISSVSNSNKLVCRDFFGDGNWSDPYSSYELGISDENGGALPAMRVFSLTEGIATQGVTLSASTPYLVSGIHTSSSVTTRINGIEVGNTVSPGPIDYSGNSSDGVQTTIGSRSAASPGGHFSGDLGELLMYGSELTETEINTIEEYLALEHSLTP